MKHLIRAVGLVLLAAVALSAQSTIKFGVGANAGLRIPIVQEDQGNGSVFGFKGRLKLLPMLAVEPNISFGKFGEGDVIDGIQPLEGSKVTSYGVDVTLGSGFGGPGFKPYGLLGAAFYNVKRDIASQDVTDLGYAAGLGFEIGVTPVVAVDLRAKLHIVPIDGGGSKKSATLTGGLNYYFGN